MTRKDIEAVLIKLPHLTDFGIGIFEGKPLASAAERNEEFRRNREALLESAADCSRVCGWLVHLEKQKTINDRHSSYGLKHMAAHSIGYVTHGVFIAAAIHCGFPFQCYPNSPNVFFGISERSIKARPREERNAV